MAVKEGNPHWAPRTPRYGVHAPLPTPLVNNTKLPQNKGFKCNALGSFSLAFSKRLMGTWHVPGTGAAPRGTPFPAPGPLLLSGGRALLGGDQAPQGCGTTPGRDTWERHRGETPGRDTQARAWAAQSHCPTVQLGKAAATPQTHPRPGARGTPTNPLL